MNIRGASGGPSCLPARAQAQARNLRRRKSATYSRADWGCAFWGSDDDSDKSLSSTRIRLDGPAPWGAAGGFAPVRLPASVDGPGRSGCLGAAAWGFVRRCCGRRRGTAAAILRSAMFLRGLVSHSGLHALSVGR